MNSGCAMAHAPARKFLENSGGTMPVGTAMRSFAPAHGAAQI